MARYIKTRTNAIISDTTDYKKPRNVEFEDTWSPDEVVERRVEVDITTAITIDLAPFATVDKLIVYNRDATNFVLVKVRQSKASATFAADEIGFTAGPPATVTDDNSTFISALYAKAGDYAVITNATETANSGTFLIQTVAAGTLTLQEDETITADADDAGTPTIEIRCENEIKLLAGQVCELTSIVPASDITLIADTAACECDLIFFGS